MIMGFSKYTGLGAFAVSALGGAVTGFITQYYFPRNRNKWDKNWDRRHPESTFELEMEANLKDNRQTHQKLAESTAIRHILLIRHGQYHRKAETSEERTLTPLGEKQAARTGKRLEELSLPYTRIIRSTMIRAIQTSDIISKFLPNVRMKSNALLEEGAPYKPEPYNNWPAEHHIYVDGPRIESAFRKYFHRALPEQKEDSYEIIVCHANVIRYFVCRALQLPLNAWYRFRLNHGSITWLTIHPDGKVVLKQLGDSGFMPHQYLTSR